MEQAKVKPAKAKKVGILFFLDAKRKNPVRRFCVLTAAKEIDYFSKDENDPQAKVGAITGLGLAETCKVTVIESSEADFTVVTPDGTFQLQAQGGDQDRRNWVLEIIKQRPIAQIVDLVRSDEKLGAYGAYALANQAGGADEWKTEIVKCGGLEPLLRFTQTSSDSGLVGLIYYSLSKLSLVDENKAAVGTHVPLLVELLRGDVAEYKGHALKTLVNLVTHPGSRARMIELDLVRVLLKALSSVPTSTQPEAGTLLLNFVGLGDEKERACSEVAAEMRLLGTWLEGWAGLKERDDRVRLYSSALASIVQTLVVVCNSTQARKDEGRRLILGPVLALLPMRGRPECESAILSFVQLYVSEHDVPSAVIERADLLAESLTSADAAVLARATLLLSIVLRAPALQARDVLWSKISPVALVDLFRAADATVRSASVDLFALLAAKPGAAAGLQRDASSFTKLGNALLADQDSLSHDLSRKLTASLAALSTVPEIKYALVTGSLRQGLLASLSTSREGALVTEQVLEVFANCTSNAGARRALADPAVLQQLLDALKSPSQDVQTRVGSVLANLSTNAHIRRELRDLSALPPIFGAIMATKNRHLRLELMGSVGNICLLGLHLSEEHIAYLISVLSSKSVKLRVASVKVLRNACLNRSNIEAMVRLKVVPPLLSFLVEQAKPDDQAHILVILSCVIEHFANAVDFLELAYVLVLIGEHRELSQGNARVLKSGLRCIAAAARHDSVFLRDHLRVLFAAAAHPDYVSSDYASLALSRCLIQNPDLLTAAVVEQVLSLCVTSSPAVLLRAVQILTVASSFLSVADCDLLSCLLDFPEPGISEAAAKLILSIRGGGDRVGTVRASPLAVLQLLQQDSDAVKNVMWEVQMGDSNAVTVNCAPLTLTLRSADVRNVFLAKLLVPNRPLVLQELKEAEQDGSGASLSSSVLEPSPEQREGLAALVKTVVAGPASTRGADLDGVLEDASHGVLSGERGLCSGAARRWGGSIGNVLHVTHGTSVSYQADYEAGPASALAEGPVPFMGEFAYFEVLISCAAAAGPSGVAVGMAETVERGRLPGWAAGSFGYHGDDGNLYEGSLNRAFGPRFGLGDVVGCGCDETRGPFFTLNGRFLGWASPVPFNAFRLRPCVGLVHSGQTVATNFGQLPFLWDFSFVVSSAAMVPPRTTTAVYPAEGPAVPVSQSVLAGGLWNSVTSMLAPRLAFLRPSVHNALLKTQAAFAKWQETEMK